MVKLRRAAVVLMALGVVGFGGPAGAVRDGRAPADPLAYWGGAGTIVTAALDGTVAQTVPGLGPYFSIGGGALVGIRDRVNGNGSDALGSDAVTGATLFTIKARSSRSWPVMEARSSSCRTRSPEPARTSAIPR